jgi:hypothetical protein
MGILVVDQAPRRDEDVGEFDSFLHEDCCDGEGTVQRSCSSTADEKRASRMPFRPLPSPIYLTMVCWVPRCPEVEQDENRGNDEKHFPKLECCGFKYLFSQLLVEETEDNEQSPYTMKDM